MAVGGNEVEAHVDTGVGDDLLPGDGGLLLLVMVVLLLDVGDNGLPALVVVELLSESRGVNDGELELHALLLND